MDTRQILNQLRSERDRLNQAIAALESLETSGRTVARGPVATPTHRKPRRRRISAAGRARIAAAARAMWARRKRQASPAPKKTTAARKAAPARRGMSAAARRKLSAMMKERWAARKSAAKTA